MKRMFTKGMLTLLLAAGTLGVCAETQLIYRGRMTNRAGVRVSDAELTFQIYEAEKGGTSVWGYKTTVTSDANGSFQVVLSDSVAGSAQLVAGATLANVLQTGRAKYLGITVGKARELTPREAINATPRVQYATRAQGLAAGASTGTLTAETLTAADVKLAQSATVTKRLMLGTNGTNKASLAVVLDEQAFATGSLRVKGAGVMPIWDEWEVLAESCMSGRFFTAPVSGVYFISSLNHCPKTKSDIFTNRKLDTAQQGWYAPGLVIFGKAGVTYELPHLGQYSYIGTTGETSDAIRVLFRRFNIQ